MTLIASQENENSYLGQTLKVEKIQSTEVAITPENLPKGIYLTKIKSAGKTVDTKKMIVR
ncbi:MAG TPA: T9SS type A sorting domain-containing protein [Flavobacteriaceae bacterium]|nr:T9SS type A sorting domain-containing protein [Flavobacteriaceae bacterium]